jgi:hypothetical protein
VGVALRRSLVMGALPAMMENRCFKGDTRKKRLSFVKQVFSFSHVLGQIACQPYED